MAASNGTDGVTPSPTNSHDARDRVSQLPEYLNVTDKLKNARLGPADSVNLTHEAKSSVLVKYSARFKDEDDVGLYKMESKPRGYALVVNNINFHDEDTFPTRNGAANDENGIKAMLEQFYFIVEAHRNKTQMEMQNIVNNFSQKEELKKAECIVVVFMSHGEEGQTQEDTKVIGTDGIGLRTNDIVSYFFTDHCPAMAHKPKIFLFQSCRGDLTDPGVNVGQVNHRTEYDGKPQNRNGSQSFSARARITSDIYIAYPVAPGRKANRDIYNGAWFIQAIVEEFSSKAHKNHLDDLFKLVDKNLKRKNNLHESNFQAVTTIRLGWDKHLYFNPGLHKIDGRIIREDDANGAPAGREGMDVVDMIKPKPNCQKKPKRYEKLDDDDNDEGDQGCYPRDKCNPC